MARRAAFTLIELLVVIAIIAVIIAILFLVAPKVRLRVDEAAPTPDPQRVTPNDGNDPALPPAPGNYMEFDWEVDTDPDEQEPTDESFDFGPGVGESRVTPRLGVAGDFTGTLRLENVNGDLQITSDSTNGFVGFGLPDSFSDPDGQFALYNQDPFSTHGELTIPASEVAGKSILDILPDAVPLFLQSVPGTNVTIYRDDTEQPVGSLTLFTPAPTAAAVPEPSSVMAWIAVGLAGITALSQFRRFGSVKEQAQENRLLATAALGPVERCLVP